MPKNAYAAITLGSNSFNMLVAYTRGKQPRIIAKYKRKVRLAEGIEEDGSLSQKAIERGLDCIAMFTDMLDYHKIKTTNVAIIATATLRNINNPADFTDKALSIIGCPVEIISGMREAELIYQGMIAHSQKQGRNLVIDIGGGSTEFIIGEGKNILFKTSLAFGCVTFNRQFFNNPQYRLQYFIDAAASVSDFLSKQKFNLTSLSWQTVLGASGSVQSVIEILSYRKQPQFITLDILINLRDEILAQTDLSLANIKGLNTERAPTFAAGIAILIAIFEQLHISKLCLSGGALREGVLQELAHTIK